MLRKTYANLIQSTSANFLAGLSDQKTPNGSAFNISWNTAAETGGICRRHVTIDNTPRRLPEKEDFHLIVSPEGKTFTSSEDLPTLPFPKKMVVGRDYLDFDGWIIRICPCSKSLLLEHPSAEPASLHLTDVYPKDCPPATIGGKELKARSNSC